MAPLLARIAAPYADDDDEDDAAEVGWLKLNLLDPLTVLTLLLTLEPFDKLLLLLLLLLLLSARRAIFRNIPASRHRKKGSRSGEHDSDGSRLPRRLPLERTSASNCSRTEKACCNARTDKKFLVAHFLSLFVFREIKQK